MLKILAAQTLVILFYAVIWFVVAVVRNRNDVADIAWGGGFVCAAVTACLAAGINGSRALLVLFLVTAWGLRLMLHIGIRNRGKPEDRRYQAWRREWGSSYLLRSFLQVFLLQGFLLLVISLPVTHAIVRNGPPLSA
jgi:steroid 5-alpha reductase family enzyme